MPRAKTLDHLRAGGTKRSIHVRVDVPVGAVVWTDGRSLHVRADSAEVAEECAAWFERAVAAFREKTG